MESRNRVAVLPRDEPDVTQVDRRSVLGTVVAGDRLGNLLAARQPLPGRWGEGGLVERVRGEDRCEAVEVSGPQ